MNQLDVLIQHPTYVALLLAEAIGWLHDYRKCSEEHLKEQAANSQGQALSRSDLSNRFGALTGVNIHLLPIQLTARTVTDLLNDKTWSTDILGEYLSRCHNTAHFDKQEPVDRKQIYPSTQLSSPFGFERDIPAGLTNKLWALPWPSLATYSQAERQNLLKDVCALFSQVGADTRRPINEVDLWGWGALVGTLYKAALAGALLAGSTLAAHDLRWRLLGVRVSGLDFLLNVARIPDLLAKQELLTDSLDNVRTLLESTYPLGSEVYRDEGGSIYVVPDIPDLLERKDSAGTTLRSLVLEEFANGTLKSNPTLQLGCEITPHLELEAKSWWGQDPDWQNKPYPNNELPAIEKFVSQLVVSMPEAADVERVWKNGRVSDICIVCGLRPQGPDKKASDRNVCDICEERRADRSKEWADSQSDKTIWTDEIADTNGRLALIVGHFDMDHWLDGSLLESLFLIAPHDPENTTGKPITNKTPSFSRLRRMWETTHRFWQEVQDETIQQMADDRRRLKVYLDHTPNLGPFHVYDLKLGATDMSMVWTPQDGGYLISADNLGYIARQLGAEAAVYNHPATAAIFVEDYLRTQFTESDRQPVLHNPDAQASRSNPNLLAGVRIAKVEYQQNQYATTIPILAEPRTFMMLIPADKSLQVLCHIKEKYENEMGKVRDRLPIHQGIVYASRRTPIRAVFAAGRAMFDYRTQEQQWKVKSVCSQTQSSGAAHFNETVLLELKRGDHQITWRIPLKMGDGIAEDRWYPYVFLETEGDDSKADEANRRAVRVSRPTGGSWIVHAGDLRVGETIYIKHSTFDFEFLNTTGRRFEIYYDANGRRPRRTRPFYLEDLDRLDDLWKLMKRLAVSQRHQIICTIEATREEWYGAENSDQAKDDCVFRQFVADTLAGATWPKGQTWNSISQEWRDKLILAGANGELTDLAELHMEILKER